MFRNNYVDCSLEPKHSFMQQIKLVLIAPQNRHSKFGLYPKHGGLPQLALLQTDAVICMDTSSMLMLDLPLHDLISTGASCFREDWETGIMC